jgi:nicotinamide riboside transporter PnuC
MIAQLLASVLTMASMWLMGNRSVWGPVLGLVSQVPWLVTILTAQTWGLLPVCIAMVAIHSRNILLWEARELTELHESEPST